jgi:hypothetical protein
MIPVLERVKPVHALDRAAIVIDSYPQYFQEIVELVKGYLKLGHDHFLPSFSNPSRLLTNFSLIRRITL